MRDLEEDLNRINTWVDRDNTTLQRRLYGKGGKGGEPLDVDLDVDLEKLGHEARHAFSSIIQDLIVKRYVPTRDRFVHFVTYEGKMIFKSTLVSQLVGNPLFSRDNLTRVKQSYSITQALRGR